MLPASLPITGPQLTPSYSLSLSLSLFLLTGERHLNALTDLSSCTLHVRVQQCDTRGYLVPITGKRDTIEEEEAERGKRDRSTCAPDSVVGTAGAGQQRFAPSTIAFAFHCGAHCWKRANVLLHSPSANAHTHRHLPCC